MEKVQRLFKYVLKRNQRKMTEEQIKIPKDVCAKAKVSSALSNVYTNKYRLGKP